MIRVGIDLEYAERFSSMDTPGRSVLYRNVFTLQEQQECARSPALLATCFTAKEAVSKVLGTGLTINEINRVTCHSIEILDAISSEPKIKLTGVALREAQRLELDQILLRHDLIDNKVIVLAIGASKMAASELRAILKTAFEMHIFQLCTKKHVMNQLAEFN